MKGKLTPKESFVLYGVFIVAAFRAVLTGTLLGQKSGERAEPGDYHPGRGGIPFAGSSPYAARDSPGSAERNDCRRAGAPAADQPVNSTPAAFLAGSRYPGKAGSEAAGNSGRKDALLRPPTNLLLLPRPQERKLFSIQVGALKTEEEARKVIVRLEARGYTGILDKPVSQKDPFYRVRVGITRPERTPPAPKRCSRRRFPDVH